MYNVRVIIKDGFAFTPDTQEERAQSIIMAFSLENAEKLICGFGVILPQAICLN